MPAGFNVHGQISEPRAVRRRPDAQPLICVLIEELVRRVEGRVYDGPLRHAEVPGDHKAGIPRGLVAAGARAQRPA